MSEGSTFLPYGRQVIDDSDINAVVEVLKSDFLTTGPAVPKLEAALSERLDGAHVVVCANGTAALHLMAMELARTAAPLVIVPAITFLATANAVRYVGGEVEFCDVDPATGLATVASVAAAMSSAKARFGRAATAACVVHLAGQTVDMPAMAALAQENGLTLLDDAAHAIGTQYSVGNEWLPVGNGRHAAMTAFSFHPVKTMTMGEGGAIATRDRDQALRLSLARSHGMQRDPALWLNSELAFDAAGQPNPWYYEMAEPGYNYRATDMQAALGYSQLQKLDGFIQRRANLMAHYRTRLTALAPAVAMLAEHSTSRASWHLCMVHIDFSRLGRERAAVMQALRQRGIGTQVHYIPLHYQPYYRARYGKLSLPGAETFYDGVLSLPLYPSMTTSDVDRVVSGLAECLGLA